MADEKMTFSKEEIKTMGMQLAAVLDWVSTPPPAWVRKRNQYMRGDWVLLNGKPHLWTLSDSTRNEVDMMDVEDMPLTADILRKHGFDKIDNHPSFDLSFDDGEEFCGISFPNDTDGGIVCVYPLDYSQELTYVFNERISVAKFQHLLRDAGCYELERMFTHKGDALTGQCFK